MTKIAELISYIFHPVFITFFNFLYILLNIGNQGPVVGFTFMLFLFFIILIPVFFTFLIVYRDKKNFKLKYYDDIETDQRTKILAISILHYIIFLIIVANLHIVFLGYYKPMITSMIMGMVMSTILSFIFHFFNFKNSLHSLSPAFFSSFYIIFLWNIPGLDSLNTFAEHLLNIGIITNLIILIITSFARVMLKKHNWTEIAAGVFIGVICPLLLTLLSNGI
ncbi:MAG: hypothetical protein IT243_08070 [Bacteroidia bacterium]|nr:hypothetical protein [Bacteroidia bacterium]